MANELCASGFGTTVDGNYQSVDTDFWKNNNSNYWIYKDSYNWIISSSPSIGQIPYAVATKTYVPGSWVNGHYTGTGTNPSGDIALGTC